MNTIYKVIWNSSLGIWIAVSELAKGRIKSKNINNGRVDYLKKNNFRRIIVCGLLSVFITPTYAVRTITISGTSGDLVSPTSTSTDQNSLNYSSWENPNSPAADLGTNTGLGVIIGNGSSTNGGGNTIYGNNNKSISSNTIILGNANYSNATNGLTIGHRSSTAGNAPIAIASLPQPTEYGNTMMAVGTGVWEGETGFSIGASGVTKESRIFNASKPVHYVWKFATTTNSRGTWGGGASVGIQWK